MNLILLTGAYSRKILIDVDLLFSAVRESPNWTRVTLHAGTDVAHRNVEETPEQILEIIMESKSALPTR